MASTGVEAASSSMEITVSKADLLRELTATQGVVERKTTIPILSNFLFEAAGDKLSITATDLDLGLRTSCAAKVKKEGSCTIPARKLYDYVKLLPEGDISIKTMENHWVQIRSGRSNTKMVGMARANYPQVRRGVAHAGIPSGQAGSVRGRLAPARMTLWHPPATTTSRPSRGSNCRHTVLYLLCHQRRRCPRSAQATSTRP